MDDLTTAAYLELRRLANGYVRHERARSVQATDLVHEAYLRIAQHPHGPFENRGHFVAIAAIAMRRLLVERARRRGAAKRGGGRLQVTLDDALLSDQGRGRPEPVDLVALDRALDALGRLDPQQARIVELRFFGGLSIEEAADALSLSPATVKRHWTIARAWLRRALEGPST